MVILKYIFSAWYIHDELYAQLYVKLYVQYNQYGLLKLVMHRCCIKKDINRRFESIF